MSDLDPGIFDTTGDVRPHNLSRRQIAQKAGEFGAGATAGLGAGPGAGFRFPEDVDDRSYGIDVSHHQGTIDWQKVAGQGPIFAYVKATEGQTYVDERFIANYTSARSAGIAPGAYHFLSANVDVQSQVDNYVGQVAPLRKDGDLAPALDLEWDFEPRSNPQSDRWSEIDQSKIADKALFWLNAVEELLGVRPIVYTNKSWWDARLGDQGDQLGSYRIWMSRYGEFTQPDPPMMTGSFDWVLWQFTDKAKVAGVEGPVDASVASDLFDAADIAPQPQICTIGTDPVWPLPLTDAELAAVYDQIRDYFGSLTQPGVETMRVLINSANPDSLRALMDGRVPIELSDRERTAFFDLARECLGGGQLEQRQVNFLTMLLQFANPGQVRACLL